MDDIFDHLLATGGGIFVDETRKIRDSESGKSSDRKKASLGKPIENVPDIVGDYDYEEIQRKSFMRSVDDSDVELDDMIWFVSADAPTSPPQSPMSPSSPSKPTEAVESTFIRRRTNPESFPVPRSIEVDWRATIFLNIITQWEYILTVAVCRSHAEGRKDLVALKWSTRRVYAQPSNNNYCTQKKKKHAFQNTWPHIFFSVDDFQEAFGDIRMGEGYCWCVELVAVSKKSDRIPVFRGVVPYDKMVKGFAATSSANKKNASFLSRKEEKTQIISMRGPEGRGNAKAEVSKVEPKDTLRCCLVQVSAFWGDIVYCLEYPVRSTWLTIPTEEELKQELILNEELETARKNAARLNKLAESDSKGEEKGFGLMKVFSGIKESIQKKLDGEVKISLPAIGSTVEVIELKQGDWRAFNGKQGIVKDYHSTINDALIVTIDGTSVTIKVNNIRVINNGNEKS